GAFETNRMWAAFGASGIVLGAAYMLWLYQRVFFGKLENEKNKNLPDLSWREWAYFTPLLILAFWIGVYPKPVFDYIDPPTNIIVQQAKPSYFNHPAVLEAIKEGKAEGEHATPAAGEHKPAQPESAQPAGTQPAPEKPVTAPPAEKPAKE